MAWAKTMIPNVHANIIRMLIKLSLSAFSNTQGGIYVL